jgi:hypothetical protein
MTAMMELDNWNLKHCCTGVSGRNAAAACAWSRVDHVFENEDARCGMLLRASSQSSA